MTRPVIALAGLTACSGCQLTFLNCEQELAELTQRFYFAFFPMGRSILAECPQFDVAFVEGAVSTPDDLELLLHLRTHSRFLVAFGTCAVWGGVAAMKNHLPREELLKCVYGEESKVRSFNPAAFSRFVTVDFTITGCPPEKDELLTTLDSLRHGTFPVFPGYPVCTECRNRENRCVLIHDDQLCLGPLIQSGCNARCPAAGIPCEGCRGPAAESNVAAEVELLEEKGFRREQITSRLQRFYPEWDHEQRY